MCTGYHFGSSDAGDLKNKYYHRLLSCATTYGQPFVLHVFDAQYPHSRSSQHI